MTRLRARLSRLDLDRELAAGVSPVSCALLAARAAQLTADCTRRRIAEGLERMALVDPTRGARVRTVPRAPAMLANRDDLLGLADRLRRGGALYAQGIAMLELVLIDGTGPAYTDSRGEGLTRQLALARAGLTG
ncbi:MAG: hypothetical protein WBQ18_10535 [Solirubrobacteraceae bacterium]